MIWRFDDDDDDDDDGDDGDDDVDDVHHHDHDHDLDEWRGIPCTGDSGHPVHKRAKIPCTHEAVTNQLGSWPVVDTGARHKCEASLRVDRAKTCDSCAVKTSMYHQSVTKLVGISTIYIRDNDNGVKWIQCMFKHVQTIWWKFGCVWRSVHNMVRKRGIWGCFYLDGHTKELGRFL